MQTSVFLARLLGPTFVLIGLGMLSNRQAYRSMAEELLRSTALTYIAGALAFLGGLAIVLTHNVWASDWRIVITLIGWLTLLRGAFRILLPRKSMAIASKVLTRDGVLIGAVVVVLALGAILCFFGYVR